MTKRPAIPETRRFEILREIGAGGAGRVYLARDRYTGAGPLALKILDLGGDGVFATLEAEFLALTELSHPGLVRAHERGVLPETGQPWFTSDYHEGSDFLTACRDASPTELLDRVVETLRVLESIHRRGWVHCDLKPGNLLVTADGGVKLLDFGLAAREGDRRPEGLLRGTLPYVAPETLQGRPVDRRADLYSLGVVLYQVLTDEVPERGEDLLPRFSDEVLLGLAEPFDSLVHRLLARDPDHRPRSAARVLELLSSSAGREIPVETEETLRAQLSGGHFIGREVELGSLMGELRSVILGNGRRTPSRLHLVRGETGVGKHRLLLEFKDRSQREGVDFFPAVCFEGEEAAYGSMAPLLRAVLARVGPDSSCARRSRPALRRVIPDLVGDGGEPDPLRGLGGEEERFRWLEQVVGFLREAAQGRRGFVLAVEEIHRASLEMVEFLGYLARSLCAGGDVRPSIILVMTIRSGVDLSPALGSMLADLGGEALLHPIDLRRFGEDEVREYVRAVLGVEEPPRRLVEMLHRRTGGNVLFLEQLLRSLVEDGTIYYRSDRWRVSDLSRVRLPDSVTQVVERRIAHLSGEQVEILEAVAAYAEPVPLTLLSRLFPGAEKRLEPLLRHQILKLEEGGRSVALRHSVVGDLALSRAGPARIRSLHGRIGQVLEEIHEEEGDGVRPEKLAHHVSLGDDRVRALRLALDVARRSSAEGKHDQAATFYRRALARIEREDPRRPELLDALGDAHAGAGRFDLAAGTFRMAVLETSSPSLRISLHRKLADVLERTGAYDEALTNLRTGLDLVEPGDAHRRIPFLRLLGALHRRRGDYPKAIRRIRDGLRLARGEPSEEVAALLNLLGNVYMLMGDHRKALNFHLRSLRIAKSLGFDAGAASALHNLGTLMNEWGDAERAISYYRDSLRITERQTNLPAVALTYNNIANLQSETGDFERAEYYHRRCLAIRRRIGDPFGIAMSFGNIGSMHRLRGRWGLALAYYNRAIRHFLRIGNEYGAAFFRTHHAELLLLIGELDRAGELLRLAGKSAAQQQFGRIEARVQLLSGRLFRHRGRHEDALSALAQAEAIDRRVGNREGVVEARLETALVHGALGRKGHALRAVGAALAEARASRSQAAAALSLLHRGELGMGAAERSRVDVQSFIEHAEKTRRPDALAHGLAVRARRRLDSGDLAGAGEDAGEALRLTREIAASLPEELTAVFWRDSRRRTLDDLAERARAGREEAGKVEASADLLLDTDEMKSENLLRLLEINKRLNSETDLRSLLEFIMDTAVEITGAERGFLLLVEKNAIAFQIARNFKRREVEEPELKISQSIVRHVMQTGETLLTDNATEDERLSKFRSVDNLKLTSILSVPFVSRGKRLGALYLDNQAKKGVFSEEDVEALTAMSDQAAIAIENLRNQLKLAEQLEAQDSELKRVKKVLDDRPYKYDYDEIIGSSSRMKEVFLLLDKIIDTEVPVLIQGGSGTGKELVAQAIHYKGPRGKGPFVTVNCGAVPENLLESEFFGYVRGAFTGANTDKTGLFVQADGGTLFLDEIGDMDFDMQKKLLRVLQQGEVRPVGGKKTVEVDVRIVCATNKDLRQRMMEGKFREDLYYRINVIAIHLPPLKERPEDIPLLIRYFMGRTAEEMGIPVKELEPEVTELLNAYSWPGNVRELQNETKKAMALADDIITVADLSPHIQGVRDEIEPTLVPQKGTLKETMEATEKSIIVRALDETGGNQTRAAKNLGISRVWLRKKMEKYGLLD